MASLAKLRTRWAAIGAACAVTLGGGTFGIVQASVSSGDRAVYVPITPVRVLDTRSDVGVATIQDATPALLTVTGSIATTTGQQNVVPVGASSVCQQLVDHLDKYKSGTRPTQQQVEQPTY